MKYSDRKANIGQNKKSPKNWRPKQIQIRQKYAVQK